MNTTTNTSGLVHHHVTVQSEGQDAVTLVTTREAKEARRAMDRYVYLLEDNGATVVDTASSGSLRVEEYQRLNGTRVKLSRWLCGSTSCQVQH